MPSWPPSRSAKLATRLWPWTLVLVALAAPIGCASTPPPAPPPPPAAPPPPPPAPRPKVVEAPPVKKCLALAEECVADRATRVRIANAPMIFTPADGWAYAEESDATVMQRGEGGPTMAITGYASGDPKTEAKAASAVRDATLHALLTKLAITPPKEKIAWASPQTKGTTQADVHVWIYQLGGAIRSGKKGPIVVVMSPPVEGVAILGVGFVADDDATNADDEILSAIGSIAPRPDPSTSGGSAVESEK